MKIEVDLNACKRNNLTPNQYVLLKLMYEKDYTKIEEIFGRQNAIKIRDSLLNTKYVLGDKTPFKQTILSNNHVCLLLGIRNENINFLEFYNCYPIRVGSRVLRAGNVDTVLGKKHEKKYLIKVTTQKAHQQAIKATMAFVAKKKQTNSLQYLPNIETVINNAMWETWEDFIETSGEEGMDWNEQSI